MCLGGGHVTWRETRDDTNRHYSGREYRGSKKGGYQKYNRFSWKFTSSYKLISRWKIRQQPNSFLSSFAHLDVPWWVNCSSLDNPLIGEFNLTLIAPQYNEYSKYKAW